MMARSDSPLSDAGRGRPRSRDESPRGRSRSESRPARGGTRSPDGSRSRTRSRSYSSRSYSSRSRSRSRSYSRSPTPPATKIMVERLTKNVLEDHVHEIFGAYGEIAAIDFPMNPQTHTNRGVCYIDYAEPDAARTATARMNDGYIDGAQIRVGPPRRQPSPPRRRFNDAPRGRGRGGRFGGRMRDTYRPASRSPSPYYRRRESYGRSPARAARSPRSPRSPARARSPADYAARSPYR
ncbi:uncharacterized protein V1510DRAFT_440602 [Dipodascopsis tothii]|uniref:uncharacterized protein n=1 Tax=Dipodascopsis tothii TaxID=44089 RepID=UPI0034CEB83F